jgi:RNA 2',3'-cyclic 3'-phosphodiesterase
MNEQQPSMVTFFALWPDVATARALADLATRTADQCRGRATSADRIHLTLAYLGATVLDRLPALYEFAQSVDVAPFVLTLDRIGCWAHNHLAWAGAEGAPDALSRLQAQLSEAAGAMGFRLDARPFVPHVTLARKLHTHFAARPMQAVAWHVDQFCLMRSESNPVRYTTLHSWRLGNVSSASRL